MIRSPAKNYGENDPSKQSKFSASSRLNGKIVSSETIIIEGRLDGQVLINGSLEINQNAEINGNIKADKLSMHGKVKGNLCVADSLLVERTAMIQGDIKAGMVTIIQGAIINGQCSIGRTPDSQNWKQCY